MSDFIDCSVNHSKLVRIEEDANESGSMPESNESMLFSDDKEIVITPKVELVKTSARAKNSRNINALCNELSSSMEFEGKFGS